MNTIRMMTMAGFGLAIATPLLAQEAPPRWRPTRETVTVTGLSQLKNLRAIMTGSHIAEAFAVSASVPVPYSDLVLTREADAGEFDRRIDVAAKLVCRELDIKYPPMSFPLLGPDTCVKDALNDGLTQAHQLVAAARK